MNPELWKDYCTCFVGDAFVGNFDRYMGNWGYLVSKINPDEPPMPAPIYDNGSTLFPSLSSTAMTDVLSNPKELMKRTLLFPKAAMAIDKNKVAYLDMLSSNFDPAMTLAVRNKVPEIRKSMPEIQEFIDDQTFLSDTKKTFYKTMRQARLDFVLEPAYEACCTRTYNQAAYDRLQNDRNYEEKNFGINEIKKERCRNL